MSDKRKLNINILKNKRIQWTLIVIAILIYISFYIPVPYYISMPGSTFELSTIIEVEEGYQEQGDFMLTTVSMMPATAPTYIYSKFDSYMEAIPKEYILNTNEDQEDYSKRQLKAMQQSQDDAIIAAFNYIDMPINISEKGVLVLGIVADAPSEEVLEVGDLIIAVDYLDVKTTDELLSSLVNKEAGETINITFIRENKTYTENIELIELNQQPEDDEEILHSVGIGIYPYNEREVAPSRSVNFSTEDIGGPSAGLMFSLEIINRLIPEDLTKGYRIAGTGTLDSSGVIGQIGGARLKVKTADENDAEIFFVPKDIYAYDINQKEAEEANKELGSHMQIVPVATLDEAVQFLQNLP